MSQVDAYIASLHSDSDAENVLAYWKGRENSWTCLAQVACNILGVPAASTSSEQTFSVAGRTLDDRRNQLKPDTVDGLLFVHGLKH